MERLTVKGNRMGKLRAIRFIAFMDVLKNVNAPNVTASVTTVKD